MVSVSKRTRAHPSISLEVLTWYLLQPTECSVRSRRDSFSAFSILLLDGAFMSRAAFLAFGWMLCGMSAAHHPIGPVTEMEGMQAPSAPSSTPIREGALQLSNGPRFNGAAMLAQYFRSRNAISVRRILGARAFRVREGCLGARSD